MDLKGKATLQSGNKVVLQLELASSSSAPPSSPPQPERLLRQIEDGDVLVHPTKAQISARRTQMQICNIQRGCHLIIGAAGQWNAEAHEKLLQWLLKAEQKRSRTETPSPSSIPALQDAPVALAIMDGKMDDVDAQPDLQQAVRAPREQPPNLKEVQAPNVKEVEPPNLAEAIHEEPPNLNEEEQMTHLSTTHRGHPSQTHPLPRLLHLRQSASSANRKPPSEKCVREPVAVICADCARAVDHLHGLLAKALE